MGEDYQRALELSFAYGYGCYVFKHDIRGDQPEIPDCKPDSPGFLSPECFTGLGCLPVSASFEDATIVGRLRRSLGKVPLLGI